MSEETVDYIELDNEELFEKRDGIQKKYGEKLEKLFKDFEEKSE